MIKLKLNNDSFPISNDCQENGPKRRVKEWEEQHIQLDKRTTRAMISNILLFNVMANHTWWNKARQMPMEYWFDWIQYGSQPCHPICSNITAVGCFAMKKGQHPLLAHGSFQILVFRMFMLDMQSIYAPIYPSLLALWLNMKVITGVLKTIKKFKKVSGATNN